MNPPKCKDLGYIHFLIASHKTLYLHQGRKDANQKAQISLEDTSLGKPYAEGIFEALGLSFAGRDELVLGGGSNSWVSVAHESHPPDRTALRFSSFVPYYELA